MGLLSKETFVCLDCEATGLDPKEDKIIEIAAVKFTFDEELEHFETLIDPQCEIPASSTEIHHITKEMIVDQPKIQDILPTILKLVDKHILVGHGVLFDILLIAENAKKHRIPCRIESLPYIDTLRLARLYGESSTNSLKKLCEHFNVEFSGAHRAMNDVLANITVFKHLSTQFKKTEEILHRLTKPIALKCMPLGKHKQRPFSEIPLEYLEWAARQNFDQDLLFSLHSEIKKRKTKNPFLQASNPFSSL